MNDRLAELHQWIVNQGVSVRDLRKESQDEIAGDTGDYLHWLERKVLELRQEIEMLNEELLDAQ